MKNYELTKYPKLYKNTYWGGFVSSKEEDGKIIKVRNNFAENFKLIKNYKNKGYRPGQIFDHLEVYQKEDKSCIIVVSPYIELDKEAFELGFIKLCKPFYSKNAYSYYKEFNNKRAFGIWLKNLY